jgi:hypothetical protein
MPKFECRFELKFDFGSKRRPRNLDATQRTTHPSLKDVKVGPNDATALADNQVDDYFSELVAASLGN